LKEKKSTRKNSTFIPRFDAMMDENWIESTKGLSEVSVCCSLFIFRPNDVVRFLQELEGKSPTRTNRAQRHQVFGLCSSKVKIVFHFYYYKVVKIINKVIDRIVERIVNILIKSLICFCQDQVSNVNHWLAYLIFLTTYPKINCKYYIYVVL
jgi:hypothetical protein